MVRNVHRGLLERFRIHGCARYPDIRNGRRLGRIVPGFTRFPPKWPQDFGKNAKAGNDLAIRERGDLCEPRRSFGPGQNACAPRLCHRCVLDVHVGDFSRRFVVAGYQKDLHVFRARRAFLQY